MIARWLTILETYDFYIQHRKGPLHGNADALSRLPRRKCKRPDCPDCSSSDSLVNSSMSSAKEIIPIFPLLDNQNDSNSNWLTNLAAEEIGQMQHSDNVIMTIFYLKDRFANKPAKHVLKNCSFKVRILWSIWESFVVQNGLLYRKYIETGRDETEKLQLVVPYTLQKEIFQQLHVNKTACHLGRDRTLKSINRRFYWPGKGRYKGLV